MKILLVLAVIVLTIVVVHLVQAQDAIAQCNNYNATHFFSHCTLVRK
jgi:hypothetical protein